jgi:CDP-diacylglycerol--glycerol-3-phosphate 3-phosphatidyltransferase
MTLEQIPTKTMSKKSIANSITIFRIVCSIALLFCPVFSLAFYAFYITAGLSDMVDGWVARRTHTESELGAKLDTIADVVFVVVCLVKLLPVLDLSVWLYVWIGVVAIIKVVNIVSGFVVRKQFVTVHSTMNKVSGLLLFVLPLTFSFIDLKYSAIVVCVVTTFAAIQEGHFIRTNKTL